MLLEKPSILSRPWVQFLGIAAFVFAAHCGSLINGFIWDDNLLLTNNSWVSVPWGLFLIWFEPHHAQQYYPMVFTSFWVEHKIWGYNPLGYHAVNIALHIFNSILIWRVLKFLKVPGAWFIAVIFGVHPVHVESVAWISERKNVLSGFFYLGSLLQYLHYDHDPKKHRASYLFSLILFIFAILSKSVTSTLPAVILLILWWKKPRLEKKYLLHMLPFLVCGFLMGMVTLLIERNLVGAQGVDWSYTWLEKGLLAGQALVFYVWKLIWPQNLSFIYPRWTINAADLVSYVYPALVAGAILICIALQKRFGKGPLVALLYFSGTLFPALGFFNIYPMKFSLVADHFQYLASIGPLSLIVAAIVVTPFFKAHNRLKVGGLLGVILGLSLLTGDQTLIYLNERTLYEDIVQKNPNSYMAHNNLGLYYYRLKNLNTAERHFREASRIRPNSHESQFNLALVLEKRGELDQAVKHFERAMTIKPTYAKVHYHLGLVLKEKGELRQAILHMRQAHRLMPASMKVYLTLVEMQDQLHKGETP